VQLGVYKSEFSVSLCVYGKVVVSVGLRKAEER
jgi:hypothetical protein